MPELILDPYSSLGEADDGEVVAFGVRWDGLPYIVTASTPLDYRTPDSDGASFPKIRPDGPQNYRVYRGDPGIASLVTTIEKEEFNVHQVQPMDEDRLLLVSARCGYGKEGADENGRLYDRSGRFLGGISLGDGIQDVAVTTDGLIWTSYFDEGVFGGLGRRDPLGGSGLVARKEDGAVAYAYEPPEGLGGISDCYAMNADGNDVWVYYYTDFPLVLIRNGSIEAHWQIPVKGADAFAVSGNFALFRGGYDNPDNCHLIELAQPEAKVRLRFRLRDRHGEAIEAERTAGRGNALFLLRGREVFKVTVTDAMSLLGKRS